MAWYVYYGLRFGLSRAETINMRFGEMADLITCDAIFSGTMQPKKTAKAYSFDEVIAMR